MSTVWGNIYQELPEEIRNGWSKITKSRSTGSIYTTNFRTDLQFRISYTSTQIAYQPVHAQHRSVISHLRSAHALQPDQSIQLSLRSPEQYALPRPALLQQFSTQLSSDHKADNSLDIQHGKLPLIACAHQQIMPATTHNLCTQNISKLGPAQSIPYSTLLDDL
ncbi:amidophosphoribosyltransferase, chloroplastic-like [Dorcoceras hygrometricum]|uniref:Amidophosphoribosyltransferase, chloroplastic-like n=1 Tax=Dorcoceras hygrometricum TaxID=472368 RepID=A0A2Z7B0B1_9LAMI|nr:amidophosphoribosyltransferase, chloroplastic-like [Dorcoceras hygrometricum]